MTEPFRNGTSRFRALLRRLRSDPLSAAYEDISARFEAASGVRAVTVAEIEAIATLYETPLDGPLRYRTVSLYRAFLRHCLEDHRLTEHEMADLEHLRLVLRLPCEDAELAQRQVAREAYARSVDDVLGDASIDEEERTFLQSLRDSLGLPDTVADNIEAMKRRQHGARDKVPPKRAELP
ncbi:MAG TPA: hypothetical protein VFZ93_03215 [Albitalea sp.]